MSNNPVLMGTASNILEKRDGMTKDRISSLPNHIRVFILSFLSTKKAATTSTLSSKWRYLWANHPNIILPGIGCTNGDLFPDFVDRFLSFRRERRHVTEFKLDCSLRYCLRSRLHTWITSAILMEVKELILRLQASDAISETITLPTRVFTSDSLRSLSISTPCVLLLPQRITLPNLKILHLYRVQFLDDKSISRLLSGCPSLEELCLYFRSLETLPNIAISSQSLRKLIIRDYSDQSTVSVEAPNLVSFNYEGDLASQWSLLEQQSSLTEARVEVFTEPDTDDRIAPNTFNLLRSLQNIRTLTMSTVTILALYRSEEVLPDFINLKELDIAALVQDQDLNALSDFLIRCPHLETLMFHEMRKSEVQIFEEDELESFVSMRTLPWLKTITFRIIEESWVEKSVLWLLVKLAPELESIIFTSVSSKEVVEVDLKNTLAMLKDMNRYPASVEYNDIDNILELGFIA